MKPCPKCSWMLKDTDSACSMCGHQLGGAAPAAQPAVPQAVQAGYPAPPPPAAGGGFGGGAPAPVPPAPAPSGGGSASPGPAVSPWASAGPAAAPAAVAPAAPPAPAATPFGPPAAPMAPGPAPTPFGSAPGPAPAAAPRPPAPPPQLAAGLPAPPPLVPAAAAGGAAPAPPPPVGAAAGDYQAPPPVPPMVSPGRLGGAPVGGGLGGTLDQVSPPKPIGDAGGAPVLVGFLVTFQDEPTGRFWPLRSGTTTLGRAGAADEADIALEDASTSGRHAAIVADGSTGTAHVQDVGSRNGTYVNEQELAKGSQRQLRDNDRLRLGSITIVIKLLASG